MGQRRIGDRTPPDDARRRSRALAVPARVRLLEMLESSPGPCTAHELAAELGVHPTAVRQHMVILVDVGLVRRVQLPPAGRGRPAIGYETSGESDPNEWLTRALAAALAEGVSAREIGRRLGRERSEQASDIAEVLVEETRRVGFHPHLRRNGPTIEVILGHCPFAAVAREQPEVICELHHGIAEGLVSGQVDADAVELHIANPDRGGCRLVVRRSETEQ